MPSEIEASRKVLQDLARQHLAEIDLSPDDSGVVVAHRSLGLDFHHSLLDGAIARRARQPGQALLRACRNKQRNISRVLDLTAGWGIDGLTLASHGQVVTWVERNPLVYAILAYSLARLAADPAGTAVAELLQLHHANAIDYLDALPRDHGFDCILLDPMFPAHKSGAKPDKEMQILQAMAENHGIDACFETALKVASRRVVVKRPLKAPPISERKADMCYREKTIRFDVYLTR